MSVDFDPSKQRWRVRWRRGRKATFEGKLLKRAKAGGIEIVATGRESWVGWVELKTEAVNERAMQHTAMVMRDIKADVLGVIEAENRVVLKEFSTLLLSKSRAPRSNT